MKLDVHRASDQLAVSGLGNGRVDADFPENVWWWCNATGYGPLWLRWLSRNTRLEQEDGNYRSKAPFHISLRSAANSRAPVLFHRRSGLDRRIARQTDPGVDPHDTHLKGECRKRRKSYQ